MTLGSRSWRLAFLLGILGMNVGRAATAPPLSAPRPGSELPPLEVHPSRGFYDKPITLRLASPIPAAVIRYTLDGSRPTAEHGTVYREPPELTNTTILRAAAFAGGLPVTALATHSFIYLTQVLRQPQNPAGFPSGTEAWNGYPSAYGMDPRVVNSDLYRGRLPQALVALPSLSVVCAPGDLFGRTTGIYLNSTESGERWERACSAELLLPNGDNGFQIDCAIRIQGNYNRLPDKTPKHSFRLLFKEKFGPTKLSYRMFPDSPVKKFDTLVLRADYNNSWTHWNDDDGQRGQRIRDAWLKDSHRAMGWLASHNRYLHLYLNGLYWGIYDAAERPDSSFAASYLGGKKEDYDAINEAQAKGGNTDAFRAMQRAARERGGAGVMATLSQHLDVTQFIDYLLLNYYAGNRDWGDWKNWYAIRRRNPAGRFQYIVWDGEQVLQGLGDDTVNHHFGGGFSVSHHLLADPEYRLAFADRVQLHCTNGGALTPEAAAARWMARASELDLAIVAESARWGYYRRDPPFTRDRDWLAEQHRLLHDYFPRRTAVLLRQLRAARLYPAVPAPTFLPHGGPVTPSVQLAMAAPEGAKIYYTTNGADPRSRETGMCSPQSVIYTGPIPINSALTVKARSLFTNSWSALVQADFTR